jgi:hypothetical protein
MKIDTNDFIDNSHIYKQSATGINQGMRYHRWTSDLFVHYSLV